MRELSTTLQEELGNWYSKKEICESVKCSPRTFSNFVETLVANDCNQKMILKRASRLGGNLYSEDFVKQFQLWLKKNAAFQGKQIEAVKQDNQQDLFIGCVATKGTPDEIRSLAEHLRVMADQKERLEIVNNANHQLQLENKQLVEENDYLKKTNDFTAAQLGYYKRKYHSYYDDYEIY